MISKFSRYRHLWDSSFQPEKNRPQSANAFVLNKTISSQTLESSESLVFDNASTWSSPRDSGIGSTRPESNQSLAGTYVSTSTLETIGTPLKPMSKKKERPASARIRGYTDSSKSAFHREF